MTSCIGLWLGFYTRTCASSAALAIFIDAFSRFPFWKVSCPQLKRDKFCTSPSPHKRLLGLLRPSPTRALIHLLTRAPRTHSLTHSLTHSRLLHSIRWTFRGSISSRFTTRTSPGASRGAWPLPLSFPTQPSPPPCFFHTSMVQPHPSPNALQAVALSGGLLLLAARGPGHLSMDATKKYD